MHTLEDLFLVKLQALVYDILPSTTAIFSYATGSRKQSAKEQFFLFELIWNSFLTRGGCASCLCACLGARLLPQSYQCPNLSEGADRVSGQLHGDKECLFSGVTKFGRVWRKVPESDAQSLPFPLSLALPESCTCTPRLFQPFLSSLLYLFPCL